MATVVTELVYDEHTNRADIDLLCYGCRAKIKPGATLVTIKGDRTGRWHSLRCARVNGRKLGV